MVPAQRSANGIASDISVRKATGYATLEQRCIGAIQNSQFVPAAVLGKAVAKETEAAMLWHSP